MQGLEGQLVLLSITRECPRLSLSHAISPGSVQYGVSVVAHILNASSSPSS